MPQSPWKESHFRELEGIYTKHGLTPIIAHIDRYIRPFHTYGIPERLEQLPVLVQANASFFLKNSTRSMAMKMLRKNRIHLLGSDCHNLTTRLPNLGDAVEQIGRRLGEDAIGQIVSWQDAVLSDG
jgi:protein-tyrosine phosphatase